MRGCRKWGARNFRRKSPNLSQAKLRDPHRPGISRAFCRAHRRNFSSPLSANRTKTTNLSTAHEVDNPARCLPRMPHPSFSSQLPEWYRRVSLSRSCRLAWSSHWMHCLASYSNRALLQLDPSRDSPSFPQAWNRTGLRTERCFVGCWG